MKLLFFVCAVSFCLLGCSGARITKGQALGKDTCRDLKNGTACSNMAGCVWCSDKFGGAFCASEARSRWLPPTVFNCSVEILDIPEVGKKKRDCTTLSLDDCDGPLCVWCTTPVTRGSCYPADTPLRRWLPPALFTCDDEPALLGKAADCTAAKSKHSCKGSCVWCKSKQFDADACVSKESAAFLPPSIFDCKSEKAAEEAADDNDVELDNDDNSEEVEINEAGDVEEEGDSSEYWAKSKDCAAATTKKSCPDSCVWCQNEEFEFGTCVTEVAAQFMPPNIFQCKTHKKVEGPSKLVQTVVSKAPASDCASATTKKACMPGCFWCQSTTYDFGSCVTKDSAKYMPPTVFKCKKQEKKHHKREDVDTDGNLAAAQHVLHMAEAGAVSAGQGALTAQCRNSKTKKACKDCPGCSWCSSRAFNFSSCVSQMAAKFLPESMFKCSAAAPLESPEAYSDESESLGELEWVDEGEGELSMGQDPSVEDMIEAISNK